MAIQSSSPIEASISKHLYTQVHSKNAQCVQNSRMRDCDTVIGRQARSRNESNRLTSVIES